MNPYIIEMTIREKREELLKEAERQRMIAEYEAGQAPESGRLAMAVGDFLIELGSRIKRRYTRKTACCQSMP